jgi:hypothetical protein
VKRTLLVLTVALVMAAMLLVSAMPALAVPTAACSGGGHNPSGYGPQPATVDGESSCVLVHPIG